MRRTAPSTPTVPGQRRHKNRGRGHEEEQSLGLSGRFYEGQIEQGLIRFRLCVPRTCHGTDYERIRASSESFGFCRYAGERVSGPGRTRTYDQGIMSPLL